MKYVVLSLSLFLSSCVLYDTRDTNSDVTDKYSTREKEEYRQKHIKAGGDTTIAVPFPPLFSK